MEDAKPEDAKSIENLEALFRVLDFLAELGRQELERQAQAEAEAQAEASEATDAND